MGGFRHPSEWEWVLPSGAVVKATLDARTATESVWLGKRLVSRAPAGTKIDGHGIPLPSNGPYRGEEGRVRFDASLGTCTFHVGDGAVAPTKFPGGPRPARALTQWAYLALGLCVIGVVSGAVAAVARRVKARAVAAEVALNASLSQSFASPDGLLVAHFPTGFTAEVDEGETDSHSAVRVTDASTDTFVGLVSIREPAASGAEQLARFIGSGIDQEWEAAGVSSEETSRASSECFGERGVVVEHRLKKGFEGARSWSCTFVHNGHSYYFFYLLAGRSSAASEKIIRRIVDATELTGEAPAPKATATSRPSVARSVEPSGEGTTAFRLPSIRPPARAIAPPAKAQKVAPVVATPRIRAPSVDPPRSKDHIVCDATGACFSTARPPPAKGVVRGR